MEIMNDYSFEELKDACWSGAEDTLNNIEEANFEDDFMDYLEDVFYDETPTIMQVNDFIRFECSEWLEDKLGEKSPDDIDNILSYFKNKSMVNYNLISMEDDEKVLEVAEQFDTIKEFYDNIDCYDTFDEFYSDYME